MDLATNLRSIDTHVAQRIHGRRPGGGEKAAGPARDFAGAPWRGIRAVDARARDQAAGAVEIRVQAGDRGQGNEAGLVRVQEGTAGRPSEPIEGRRETAASDRTCASADRRLA